MPVSFIVPLHNQLALTQSCLATLQATLPSELPHEILLFDDASCDATPEWLSAFAATCPRVRVLSSREGVGFASANNRAAAVAQGDILCLANNDLEFLPHWLEPMLAGLADRPAAGFIGNLQYRAQDGALDHRGVLFDALRRPYHDRRRARSPSPDALTAYPAVSAACCLIRRRTFLDAGGFDEAYRNGYEDIDLCLRLTRDHGCSHFVANTSAVRHHVASSRGSSASHAQRANRRLFMSRWGWPPPGPPPRLQGGAYLQRYARQPWRYNGPKLLLALARLASGRRCLALRDRLGIDDDV